METKVTNRGMHRNFRCDVCGVSYHIRRNRKTGGDWTRFMPPNFCPGCGTKQNRRKEGSDDGAA